MSRHHLAMILALAAATTLVAAPGDTQRMKTLMKEFQAAALRRDGRTAMQKNQEIQALANETWAAGDLEPGGTFYLRSHADMHMQLKQPGLLERLPPRAAEAFRKPLARATVWELAQGDLAGARVVLRDAMKITARDKDPAKATWLLYADLVSAPPRLKLGTVLAFLRTSLDEMLGELTGPEKLLEARARSMALSAIARGYRKSRAGGPPTGDILAQAKRAAELAAKEKSLPASRRLLPICLYLSEEFYARRARNQRSQAMAVEPLLRARHRELVAEAGKGAVWGFLSSTLTDMRWISDPAGAQRNFNKGMDALLDKDEPAKKKDIWGALFDKPKSKSKSKAKAKAKAKAKR